MNRNRQITGFMSAVFYRHGLRRMFQKTRDIAVGPKYALKYGDKRARVYYYKMHEVIWG